MYKLPKSIGQYQVSVPNKTVNQMIKRGANEKENSQEGEVLLDEQVSVDGRCDREVSQALSSPSYPSTNVEGGETAGEAEVREAKIRSILFW